MSRDAIDELLEDAWVARTPADRPFPAWGLPLIIVAAAAPWGLLAWFLMR